MMTQNPQIDIYKIEKTLVECRWLITHSVIDLPQFSTPEKIKTNYRSFIRECHKSWKQAEKLLIENILLIEKEIESLKKYKKDSSHKKNINLLLGLQIILELFFNTFIWIVLEWDRSSVKKVFKGPQYGSLQYQNIDSVLKYVNDVNENPDIFAIPLDFCRFTCITDILQVNCLVNNKSVEHLFIEVKSEKVNKEIQETISNGQRDSYFEFFEK